MGCDTHMYIEYRQKNSNNWLSYGRKINPGRNYFMFGILAKVRCEPEFSFSPKGLPDDLSCVPRRDNSIYIDDSGHEDTVSMAKAKKWVADGCSNFIYDLNVGEPKWVTHPDWHSHSWLSVGEFERVMDFYRQSEVGRNHPEPEYEAILASMQKFEHLGYECRVVFWFDN